MTDLKFSDVFGGSQYNVNTSTYTIPTEAENGAGFALGLEFHDSRYPFQFPNGGQITFNATNETINDNNSNIDIEFKFEKNPSPDVNPHFYTGNIQITPGITSYTIEIPSQLEDKKDENGNVLDYDGNGEPDQVPISFRSFLLYVRTQNKEIKITNVNVVSYAETMILNNNFDYNFKIVSGILYKKDFVDYKDTKFISLQGQNITEITHNFLYDITSGTSLSTNLDTLYLNDGLQIIGEYAFYGSLINNISIPDSVIDIYRRAFHNTPISQYTYKGKTITLADPDFTDHIFTETLGGFLYTFTNNTYTIPSNITTIGSSTFQDSTVESVHIHNNVINLKNQCFYGSHIKNLVIPDSVTYIGSASFAATDKLETLVLSKCITNIPDYCFNNSGLPVLRIPKNVKSIGYQVFTFSRLKKIIFEKGSPLFTNKLIMSLYQYLPEQLKIYLETMTTKCKKIYYSNKKVILLPYYNTVMSSLNKTICRGEKGERNIIIGKKINRRVRC